MKTRTFFKLFLSYSLVYVILAITLDFEHLTVMYLLGTSAMLIGQLTYIVDQQNETIKIQKNYIRFIENKRITRTVGFDYKKVGLN